MKKILMILIFSITLITLNAEENYEDLFKDLSSDTNKKSQSNDKNPSTETGFELDLSGVHEFNFHIPVDKDNFNFDTYIKSPKFLNNLGIDISYKGLKVASHWSLDIILNEIYGQQNINNIDVSKLLRVRPLENKIEYSFWKFKLGAGYQYFTWGVADKLNPTDNIDPRDYNDIKISDGIKKLPTLSASLDFYPVNFMSIEAIYVPFGEKSYFPVDAAQEIEDQTGVNVNINSPDFNPKNFKAGGKLNFYFSNVDFSFSYLYDLDPYFTPVIELSYVDLSPYSGTTAYNFYKIKSIDLYQKRLHQFGFDIKTLVKKVGLWAEFCYTMSENYDLTRYDIRNHKLNWVLGLDFNYGPNNDFYFNIQYQGIFYPMFDSTFNKDYSSSTLPTGTVIPFTSGQGQDYYKKYYYRSMTNQLGEVYEGLDQGIIAKFEWPIHNSLFKPSFIAGYYFPLIYDYDNETKYGSLLLEPEFDFMPFDSFHIILGSDLFYSWHKLRYKDVELDRNSEYGIYTQDNSIYIIIKYQWNFLLKK